MKFNAIVQGESLHEFEAYATSRKMIVRIRVVCPFGIQNSYRRWQCIIWYMVVADDEIDTFFFCISYFLYGFNTAIQHDNKLYACFTGIIHSFY